LTAVNSVRSMGGPAGFRGTRTERRAGRGKTRTLLGSPPRCCDDVVDRDNSSGAASGSRPRAQGRGDRQAATGRGTRSAGRRLPFEPSPTTGGTVCGREPSDGTPPPPRSALVRGSAATTARPSSPGRPVDRSRPSRVKAGWRVAEDLRSGTRPDSRFRAGTGKRPLAISTFVRPPRQGGRAGADPREYGSRRIGHEDDGAADSSEDRVGGIAESAAPDGARRPSGMGRVAGSFSMSPSNGGRGRRQPFRGQRRPRPSDRDEAGHRICNGPRPIGSSRRRMRHGTPSRAARAGPPARVGSRPGRLAGAGGPGVVR